MSTCGFIDSGTERIYFECWGDGDEAVILGHGMGGSHAVWYQQVAFLAPRYRVVTWDQRGFGRSTRITGDIGPVPSVGDMARLLDHLDIDRAHIVGQSMGGWSALGFAIDHPDRTISLVLADTTAGIFTPQIRRTLDDYGREIAAGPPTDRLALGLHPAIGSQLLDEDPAHSFLYTQLGSLTEPPPPMEIIPLLMTTDHTDRAAQVKARTLFVVGERDPIFPPPLIESAAGFIDGSEVAVVENTGHSPYFERPARWNDIVAGFLRQSSL
ncbi:MAG: alpha/beta hydrolase [Actinobacteria bacterium]|nr:alpha/beta hydrolase [Actinomycetota bacterium]